MLLVMLFASTGLGWNENNKNSIGYTGADNKSLNWFIQVLTYWVAYSHMIPISLYVIIELLKIILGTLIDSDVKLYDQGDKKFSSCRNSDLIEELGQVEFIFSDKTGTLT